MISKKILASIGIVSFFLSQEAFAKIESTFQSRTEVNKVEKGNKELKEFLIENEVSRPEVRLMVHGENKIKVLKHYESDIFSFSPGKDIDIEVLDLYGQYVESFSLDQDCQVHNDKGTKYESVFVSDICFISRIKE